MPTSVDVTWLSADVDAVSILIKAGTFRVRANVIHLHHRALQIWMVGVCPGINDSDHLPLPRCTQRIRRRSPDNRQPNRGIIFARFESGRFRDLIRKWVRGRRRRGRRWRRRRQWRNSGASTPASATCACAQNDNGSAHHGGDQNGTRNARGRIRLTSPSQP